MHHDDTRPEDTRWDGARRGRRAARRDVGGPEDFGFGRGRRGGPPWAEARRGGRGGRGRARRGDVRLAILALLVERPMHGYEMIQELGERTGGSWTPSPGSIYPTLQLLEEEGLIVGTESDGKRRFALTDEGRAKAEEREGPTPWEQVTEGFGPEVGDLREALATTMPAVKQVFRAGSPAQQAKAAEVLNETRRKLYEILGSTD